MNKKSMVLCIGLMFFWTTQSLSACCFESFKGRVYTTKEASICAAFGCVKCVTKQDSCLAPILPKTACCIMPAILVLCCCDCISESEHNDLINEGAKYSPLRDGDVDHFVNPIQGSPSKNPQTNLVASLPDQCTQTVTHNNRVRSQSGILNAQLAAQEQISQG